MGSFFSILEWAGTVQITYGFEDVLNHGLGAVQTDTPAIWTYAQCLKTNGFPSTNFVPRDLSSKRYNHLNRQWNLRKKIVYPRAYLLPTNVGHVVVAVRCGLLIGLQLVPNSGGHTYEAISWGTNATMVIDFRNMNKMSIEGSGNRAAGHIEPGALLGHINAYFWENGGYGLPAGYCQTVGFGGHALGGGTGYFSAQYGHTLDNVLEVEMVDGLGQVVIANEHQNQDLFWALRGVGPGFIGIVTRFKVKLFQASKIKLTAVNVRYDIKNFARAYIAFQNMLQWTNFFEPNIYMFYSISGAANYNATIPSQLPGFQIIALHIVDPEVQPKGPETFLSALYNIFENPASIIVSHPTYIQFIIQTGYAPTLYPGGTNGDLQEINSLIGYQYADPSAPRSEAEMIDLLKHLRKDLAVFKYYKSKSFFVKRYFEKQEMKRMGQMLLRIPTTSYMEAKKETGVVYKLPNATAYVHRDTLYDFNIIYEGPADPETVKFGIDYLYDFWDMIQFMDGGETYQNYHDIDVKDHFRRNYGQNLGRLIEQKRKWDPTNYFVSGLSLPTNYYRDSDDLKYLHF